MLLNFSFKNFRSFKDLTTFSMEKEKWSRNNDNVLEEKVINSKNIFGLSTAVIYGSNASGKSSMILALEFFKNLILNGSLENDERGNGYSCLNKFELIPSLYYNTVEPLFFEIQFIENNLLFKYSTSFTLGKFLEEKYNREIIEEKLYINDKIFFSREKNQLFVKYIPEFSVYYNKEIEDSDIKFTEKSLIKNQLFVVSLNLFSKKISNIFESWFKLKLKINNDRSQFVALPEIKAEKKIINVSSFINNISKISGTCSTDIGYIKENEKDKVEAVSSIKYNGKNLVLPMEVIESTGTKKIVDIMPVILSTLLKGTTLIYDELDCTLHPTVVMNICKIFHNKEININNAQLIFTTHNPIYMDADILRKEEIKFIDRNPDGYSEHYSLSKFKTNDKISVKNTTDIMRNYMRDKYGAIRDIDYSDIFYNAIHKEMAIESN